MRKKNPMRAIFSTRKPVGPLGPFIWQTHTRLLTLPVAPGQNRWSSLRDMPCERSAADCWRIPKVRIYDPIRVFLLIVRFSWNFQSTSEIHWTVSGSIFSLIGLLLLELLRIFHFREFLILRANIWRKSPKRICTRRIHTADLWWKFHQNPSSRFRSTGCDTRTHGLTD